MASETCTARMPTGMGNHNLHYYCKHAQQGEVVMVGFEKRDHCMHLILVNSEPLGLNILYQTLFILCGNVHYDNLFAAASDPFFQIQ